MPPTPTPAERFTALMLWLTKAVAAQSSWRLAAALPVPLAVLICNHIARIRQRFARLAARIQAGTYRPPRLSKPRSAPIIQRPRRPNPFPYRAGWLLRFVRESAQVRCHLETLLQDPDMLALMAEAPEAMARPIRSLCHMLLIPLPPVLAAAPPPAAAAAVPRAAPPPWPPDASSHPALPQQPPARGSPPAWA